MFLYFQIFLTIFNYLISPIALAFVGRLGTKNLAGASLACTVSYIEKSKATISHLAMAACSVGVGQRNYLKS
jgi:hypothetical protein